MSLSSQLWTQGNLSQHESDTMPSVSHELHSQAVSQDKLFPIILHKFILSGAFVTVRKKVIDAGMKFKLVFYFHLNPPLF